MSRIIRIASVALMVYAGIGALWTWVSYRNRVAPAVTVAACHLTMDCDLQPGDMARGVYWPVDAWRNK